MVNVFWDRQLIFFLNFNFVGGLRKFFSALVNITIHSMSYYYLSINIIFTIITYAIILLFS